MKILCCSDFIDKHSGKNPHKALDFWKLVLFVMRITNCYVKSILFASVLNARIGKAKFTITIELAILTKILFVKNRQ